MSHNTDISSNGQTALDFSAKLKFFRSRLKESEIPTSHRHRGPGRTREGSLSGESSRYRVNTKNKSSRATSEEDLPPIEDGSTRLFAQASHSALRVPVRYRHVCLCLVTLANFSACCKCWDLNMIALRERNDSLILHEWPLLSTSLMLPGFLVDRGNSGLSRELEHNYTLYVGLGLHFESAGIVGSIL